MKDEDSLHSTKSFDKIQPPRTHREQKGNLMTLRLKIEGMTCGGCVNRIERALRQEGATRFEMDLAHKTASVEIDETITHPEAVANAVRALGYRVEMIEALPPMVRREGKPSGTKNKDVLSVIRKRRRLRVGLALAIVLFATTVAAVGELTRAAFLKRHDLDGMSVVDMVEFLEEKTDEALDLQASVSATKLTLSDAKGTYVFRMPKDRFYLSIAPYVQRTHPCGNHSLTGCDGELKSTPFHVVIRNAATNEILHDAEVVSSGKGFFGVWVPRNVEVVVTVHSAYGSATTTRTTNADSGTCVTTMALR